MSGKKSGNFEVDDKWQPCEMLRAKIDISGNGGIKKLYVS